MKITKYLATFAAVATSVVALNTATAGAVTSPSPTTTSNTAVCDIPKLKLGEPTAQRMVEEADGKLTVTFDVTGPAGCTTPVTLAIWKTKAGHPLEGQVLFGSVTDSFGPGTGSLVANLPEDCFYQADLLVGSKATAPDGTPSYAFRDGQFITDHPLRDFKFGGTKDCTKKPEEPKTPTTPVQPVQQPQQPGQGQVLAATTPTTLPETGVAVAATFAGVSASAAGAHALVQRLKRKFGL